MRPSGAVAAAIGLGLAAAACGGKPPVEAEVILRHGAIQTGAGTVEALAVKDGLVLAAGSGDAVDVHRGPKTMEFDLGGAAVVPGLRVSLADPALIGERLLNEASGGDDYLDLSDAQSEEDAVQRARARARTLEPGGWVLGRDWDETRWVQPRPPDKRLLSDIVGANPVLFVRRGGKAGWVNKTALDRAGLQGEGLVEGEALLAVLRKVAPLTIEERQKGLLAALEQAAGLGITGVQAIAASGRLGLRDPQAGEEAVLGPWRALARSGRLPMRVALLLPAPEATADAVLSHGAVADGDPGRITLRLLLDPALGAAAGGWCGRAKSAAIDVVFASGGDPAALQAAEAACRTAGAAAPEVLPPAPAVTDQWAEPHREADAGRPLTAGEKADFVLLAAPPGAGGAMKVRSTWVGGREVYRRPG
ncbi:MAG TPA: amidohydrolase family protein [Candidatus Polarisedimenticolia bacterium]|nr:amidohydrolase family protein [Candidatus Polarisedimenticolia bacterium]